MRTQEKIYRPTLLDLFCGRGGFSKPFANAGWNTIGVDITDHGYKGYFIAAQLPDAFAHALKFAPDYIVASPPCDAYARRHLPWIRDPAPIDERLLRWSIETARASKIPMTVECSKFAARHIKADALVGQYALWGWVPAIMPRTFPPKAIAHTRTRHSPDTRAATAAEIPYQLADHLRWTMEQKLRNR